MDKTSLQKWKLISSQDISPSHWFPLERRVYQLPSGVLVDDFTVTTLADVSMVVPITVDGTVLLVRQYKPGIDAVLVQFAAGRREERHASFEQLAIEELAEEAGAECRPENLVLLGKVSGFSTKASEIVYVYLAQEVTRTTEQHLDVTEDIEVLEVPVSQVEAALKSESTWCAQSLSAWQLALEQLHKQGN